MPGGFLFAFLLLDNYYIIKVIEIFSHFTCFGV